MPVDRLLDAIPDAAGEGLADAGAAQEFEDRRSDLLGGLHLLEFEFVAPGNERTPHKLIGGNDNQNHGGDAGQQCAHVAGVGRGLDVAAQAGKLEVAIAHGEGFAEDEREPAAGHGDDGVPHQADGGEGHFELPETLPAGVAIDARRLQHLARNGFERGIEAEGEIPDLAGEDEQDDAHLDAELMAGNERDHGQHHGRQKTEHGNRLQNVENRDHPRLDARVVGGDVAVGDGEGQAEQVGNGHAHDGVKGVDRQGADGA